MGFNIIKREINMFTDTDPYKDYGCLKCKHFQRKQGYDQQWGRVLFLYFKCKMQPDRDMHIQDNRYDICDIKPFRYDNLHLNKPKGLCLYFERGENELIYMTKEERRRLGID